MNGKKYLQTIQKIDRKIENKKLEIEALYSMIEKSTSTLKEVNIQATIDNNKNVVMLSKLIDEKNELVYELNEFLNVKLQAIKKINSLDNDEYVNILMRRYILYQDWVDIAAAMNYTRQTINIKHGKALLEFEKLFT